jgi:hypothetical protein
MTPEERREQNRRDMPETTRVIDELRAAFGPDCIERMRFTEGGRTVEWRKPRGPA